MLSALAIARDISVGKLDPRDAIRLGLENIDRNEVEIRALCHFDADRLGKPGEGPLSGIAIGVKDIFDTFDMPTGYGSPIYSDHQPKTDAALVTMLRRAGATIMAKTVTTEFAYFAPGPTRNPHNLDHSPGGSSSGSAAGIAAGYFPAAIGSQTGGSIIRPASYCGIAGYKPSFKLFPALGAKCFSWSLDTAGFFAATVADVAYVAAACSGRELRIDQLDLPAPRIGIYKSQVFEAASRQMQQALDDAVELARLAGAEIREFVPDNALNAAYDAHSTIQNYEAAIACADEYLRFGEMMSDKLRSTLEQGQQISPDQYDDARRIANHARKSLHPIFDQVDILLTPSATDIAPFGLASTGEPVFNKLWTLVGTPCINVPGFTDDAAMPLGIQVVAGFGRDKKALMAAGWLENLIKVQ